jgi:hypothetical protein
MANTKVPVELFDAGAGFTIGSGAAEDTKIVFDGNAQDFYIGLDDSADDLLIGLGSTVGTTPAISIDENLKATLSGDVEIGTTAPKINLKNTDTSIVADQSLGVIEVESSDGSTGSAGTIAKLDIVASGAFDGSGHGSDFSFITGATNQSGSIALSEAMRITSTSRVGIGTTSPSQLLEISGSSDPRIRINNSTTALSAGTSIGGIEYQTNDASGEGTGVGASIEAIAEGSFGYRQQGVLLAFKTRDSGESETNTERMRIDSSGNVMVGTTSSTLYNATSGGGALFFANGPNTIARSGSTDQSSLVINKTVNTGLLVSFRKDGTQVGTISTNANSLPSDRNFKRDISDLDLGLNLITKLKPSQYNYKFDDENAPKMYGLIAQDLEDSLTEVGVEKNSTWLLQHKPNDDEKESDYDLDYLKLTPVFINAIQEQQTIIDDLKARIEILEGGE